jgi:hypothetical protein
LLLIQIEQGVPAKKGFVVEGTTGWKAVPHLSKNSEDNVARLDYFHRAFNLDDIILGTNYVVTGVRFHRIGEHIGIMVQVWNPKYRKMVYIHIHNVTGYSMHVHPIHFNF